MLVRIVSFKQWVQTFMTLFREGVDTTASGSLFDKLMIRFVKMCLQFSILQFVFLYGLSGSTAFIIINASFLGC